MAKPSMKKSRNKPFSVSEIYETIQAPDFLRALWSDLISDIQEKPTYKHLKGMVDGVINDFTETFFSKPVDGKEEMKWQTALSEISIMTYTLDTVISEVLYRRFQNEYEGIVKTLIQDLLAKNTKKASNHAEGGSMLEDIEQIFDKENPRLHVMGKKKSFIPLGDAKKSAKAVEEPKDAPPRKRGRPKKGNTDEGKVENRNTSPKRKRGRPRKTPEKTISESFDDKEKMKSENNQESDAESDMSIGNLSIDSVSSVHTSELSSFEDAVSICSGDEGEKKRVPLKVANDMYLKGKLSQIYTFEKRSERYKLMKNASSSNSLDLVKNSSSADVDSVSLKMLPKRIRKPNSKYNSDIMYCNVKDYSSPPPETGSSSSQEETNNKSSGSPKIQRKRKRSNLAKGTPSSPAPKNSAVNNASSTQNSSASKRVKASTSPLSKASTKRYDTSDLYKPRPVTGSTIGSRSTAVTLFSSS